VLYCIAGYFAARVARERLTDEQIAARLRPAVTTPELQDVQSGLSMNEGAPNLRIRAADDPWLKLADAYGTAGVPVAGSSSRRRTRNLMQQLRRAPATLDSCRDVRRTLGCRP
jgi:hypothetical protein